MERLLEPILRPCIRRNAPAQLTPPRLHAPTLPRSLIMLFGFFLFCCVGYAFNRWRGKFGPTAVPMFDYYAKRWRNAPLFEPIFAVSASTQTPGSTPLKGR